MISRLITVKELGYPCRTLLSQWIDELAPGMRKITKPHKRFSNDERRAILLGNFLNNLQHYFG